MFICIAIDLEGKDPRIKLNTLKKKVFPASSCKLYVPNQVCWPFCGPAKINCLVFIESITLNIRQAHMCNARKEILGY